MGTRCNVVINFGDTKIRIYRHYDGYLAITGEDILNKLSASNVRNYDTKKNTINIAQLVQSFLVDGNYRLESEQGGDLEYIYELNFNDVYQCGNDYNKSNLKNVILHERDMDTRKWSSQTFKEVGVLSEFQAVVTKEVKAMFARMAKVDAA